MQLWPGILQPRISSIPLLIDDVKPSSTTTTTYAMRAKRFASRICMSAKFVFGEFKQSSVWLWLEAGAARWSEQFVCVNMQAFNEYKLIFWFLHTLNALQL